MQLSRGMPVVFLEFRIWKYLQHIIDKLKCMRGSITYISPTKVGNEGIEDFPNMKFPQWEDLHILSVLSFLNVDYDPEALHVLATQPP